MKHYSFITERLIVEPGTQPKGHIEIKHMESPDGKIKATCVRSQRAWKSNLHPCDVDFLSVPFDEFRDNLSKCDGVGEEDMYLRCKVIPQIKYLIAKRCHEFPDFADSFNPMKDNLIKDIETELNKEGEYDTNKVMDMLNPSYLVTD